MKRRHPFPVMLARWLAQREAVRAKRVRLGLEGHAFLCAILRDQPACGRELQQRAHIGHLAANRFLVTMHHLKRVHIWAWNTTPGLPVRPVYAFGPGVDMPPPTVRQNGRPVEAVRLPTLRLCPAVVAFVHMLRAIEVAATRTEVEDATGLHHNTVTAALDTMVALNLAHIALWTDRPQGGAALPNYELGAGDNAPQPKRSRAEKRELVNRRERGARSFQKLRHLAAATAPMTHAGAA